MTETDGEDKKALRRRINAQRRALDAESVRRAGEEIAAKLAASELWKNAKSIYIYLDYNNEVPTDTIAALALAQGKAVAVPLCGSAGEMSFRLISSLGEVKPGYMGIREPDASAPEACDPEALVIMPGLAFDREGGRIGYGGGYYDRFLAREPGHPTAALCYDFQVLEKIPAEEHDVPVGALFEAAT